MKDAFGNEIPSWSVQDCVDTLENIIDGESMEDDLASLLYPVIACLKRLTGQESKTKVERLDSHIEVWDEIRLAWDEEVDFCCVVEVGLEGEYQVERWLVGPEDDHRVSDLLHDLANRIDD